MQLTSQLYKVDSQEIQPAYQSDCPDHLWVTAKEMAPILGVTERTAQKHVQTLTELGQIGDKTTLWNYSVIRQKYAAK